MNDGIINSTPQKTKILPCLNRFKSARRTCGIEYGISCGISLVGGGGILTGVGILWSTYQLENCLDSARDSYVNCY